MKSVCFVATTPFAVNAFLLAHMRVLADHYTITLCANLEYYPLSPNIDPRVSLIHIPIMRKFAPLHDLHALLFLWRAFRDGKFDVIHTITPKAGLLAMLVATICGVQHRFHTFTGQVWANRSGSIRFLLKLPDRLIIALATRIFSDSHSQSRLIEKEFRLSPNKAEVLGAGSICGVDTARFRPDETARAIVRQDLGTSTDDFVFLFVGRIARDKGVFNLVDAFSRLIKQRNDVALWIVGPDEERLVAELKSAAGPANAAIRWIGPTFHPEQFMAASDVFVLPSAREGFGMVIAEAAACAVPTVAYEIDGVVDAVLNGKTGLLLPNGDVDALAVTMLSLSESPEKTKALGCAAYEFVRTNFSDTEITRAWLRFYLEHV